MKLFELHQVGLGNTHITFLAPGLNPRKLLDGLSYRAAVPHDLYYGVHEAVELIWLIGEQEVKIIWWLNLRLVARSTLIV